MAIPNGDIGRDLERFTCPDCKGAGQFRHSKGFFSISESEICSKCHGHGWVTDNEGSDDLAAKEEPGVGDANCPELALKKRLDTEMSKYRVSTDGNCPSCSGSDWKLSKVIVASGTTIVDTESNGGGWGVGTGFGQGHGGVGVNYQGVNLDTKGTFTTVGAAVYAAPQIPDGYNNRSSFLNNCAAHISRASNGIIKIDGLASGTEAIKLGFFSLCGSSGFFDGCRKAYDENASLLEPFQIYEVKKALWDRTRVCCRCGVDFVTSDDKHQAIESMTAIPKFTFEGEHRKCPNCKSYVWKTLDAFFDIKIRELQAGLDTAKKRLEDAVKFANTPQKPGFLNQLWNKVENAITPTPERAQKEVAQAQSLLADIFQRKKDAIQQYSDFEKVRVCAECEKLYQLNINQEFS